MFDRSYSFEIKDNILLIHAVGKVSIEETQIYLKKILGEIDEGPYDLIISDEGSSILPLRSELETLFEFISDSSKISSKIAICVTNRVQAAMGKIMLNLVSKSELTVKVFADSDKAFEWINKKEI